MEIIRNKAFDEIQSTILPEVPGGTLDYAPSESRLSMVDDSDEVEFLDARIAIPLRNVGDYHIVAEIGTAMQHLYGMYVYIYIYMFWFSAAF